MQAFNNNLNEVHKCQVFDWCTEQHVDDWINTDTGDAERFHARDLATGDVESLSYIRVAEQRSEDGVSFSRPEVIVGSEQVMTLEEWASQLHALMAEMTRWRDVEREVADLREGHRA